MSLNRHFSSQGDYPFVPILSGDIKTFAASILDIYIVIQGEPTDTTTPVDYPITYLMSATEASNEVTLNFRSIYINGDYWDYTFILPDVTIKGDIITVGSLGGYVSGVLSYKTPISTSLFPINTPLEIESARVQWHIEFIEAIVFQNITRCNSVEDTDTLIDILNIQDLPTDVIKFKDGYNCVVSYEDNNLTFTASQGIGKGKMPNLGNTNPEMCEEPTINSLPDGVYVINGLLPVNGDIPLEVSSALYIDKEPGSIKIRKRQ
jgi:hypothetical protein